MRPAARWAASGLHLKATQPALLITVRFDDLSLNQPAAISAAVLRPGMFRISLESADEEIGGLQF